MKDENLSAPSKRQRTCFLPDEPKELEEEESLSKRVAAFMRWIELTPGMDASSCSIRHTEGFGLGVFSARQISAGERVARVPFSVCITADFVKQEPTFAARLEAGRRALAEVVPSNGKYSEKQIPGSWPIRLKLWIYLIHARFDPAAPHHAYVKLCPQRYEDPLWWSEEELQELKGTNLLAAVRQEKSSLIRRFDLFVLPLTKACPAEFPPAIFNEHALIWAWSLWASRAYAGCLAGDGKVSSHCDGSIGKSTTGGLVPLMDLFNHQRGSEMNWCLGSPVTGGVELRIPEDDTCMLDKQMWVNYGRRSNEEWLQGYGFCPPGNSENDCVELSLACLGPLALLNRKAHMLRKMGMRCQTLVRSTSQGLLRVGSFSLHWVRSTSTSDLENSVCAAFPSMLPIALAVLQFGRCSKTSCETKCSNRGDRVSSDVRNQLLDLLEKKLANFQNSATKCQKREAQSVPSLPSDSPHNSVSHFARMYVHGQRSLLMGLAEFLRSVKEEEVVQTLALPVEIENAHREEFVTEVELLFENEQHGVQTEDISDDSEDGSDDSEEGSGGSDGSDVSDADETDAEEEQEEEQAQEQKHEEMMQVVNNIDFDNEGDRKGQQEIDRDAIQTEKSVEEKPADDSEIGMKEFFLEGDACMIRVLVSPD